MEQSIRAFFAIEIPNQETLNNIIEYQGKLQKVLGPLKLVKRDLMHITSIFLGNILESEAKQLHHFMQTEINAKLFPDGKKYEGTFQGVGDFRKQVFFAKIQGVKDLLQEIHENLNEKLLEFPEIKRDTRAYHPHLTIARAKRNRSRRDSSPKNTHNNNIKNPGQQSYSQLKQDYSMYNFGSWTINEVVLKKSVLTPHGPIYSNIESFSNRG
jgi:2'-5' RNA ligase